MIGYGMAKAAVHQLVKSLAAEKSGLPAGTLAVALLPITLDTPMNRKFMPKVRVVWRGRAFLFQFSQFKFVAFYSRRTFQPGPVLSSSPSSCTSGLSAKSGPPTEASFNSSPRAERPS